MKKGIKIIWGLLCAVFVAALVIFVWNYGNLIRTVLSIKKLSDAPAYQATVYGDFGLSEYYETGSASYKELQNYCFKAMKLDFLNPNKESLDHGCSGFYAITPEGDYIICQNYDTYPYQQLPVVINTKTSVSNTKVLGIANSGYFVKEKNLDDIEDKITVGAAPYLCMDGMNEQGLGIMLATADGSRGYKENDTRVVMTDETIPTALLNKAANVDEAIEWLAGITIQQSTHPSHFLIGDAQGNSAVIEWIKGDMQVITTDKNYQIFSNFVLYDNPDLLGYGRDRYLAYEEFLKETDGVISEEKAMELLKENTISSHACWSVVYNLTQKTMKVTFYKDYENVYEFAIE